MRIGEHTRICKTNHTLVYQPSQVYNTQNKKRIYLGGKEMNLKFNKQQQRWNLNGSLINWLQKWI